MSDLVDFIRARVDDDERIATASLDGAALTIVESENGHVRNWGPERALRECEAKRVIANDLEKWERIYRDASDRLTADPGDATARAERDSAANALTHSRVAAVAVADIWKGYPGHRNWHA